MSPYEHQKTRLEADLKLIVTELKTIATQDHTTGDWEAVPVGTDTAEADGNLEADVVEEWNERRAVVADLETRYRNLTRALTKMENGTYGICELSGEPIEPERLEVNLAARTNIANRDRERELPL